jgi:hypothetical protein
VAEKQERKSMKAFKNYKQIRKHFGNWANIELINSTEQEYIVYGNQIKEQIVKIEA